VPAAFRPHEAAFERKSGLVFDRDELAAAFGANTKAIILNTPNNPTGKVFTQAESNSFAICAYAGTSLHHRRNLREHILYDGTEHVSMARIDGMRERTIVIMACQKLIV
jgi:aminotransferase